MQIHKGHAISEMIPTTALTDTRPQGGSIHYLYLPAAIAALGGIAFFGFDTAVINGAIVFLKRQFALTELQTEVGASSLLLRWFLAQA